jgi:hypothetical protein
LTLNVRPKLKIPWQSMCKTTRSKALRHQQQKTQTRMCKAIGYKAPGHQKEHV